MINTSEIVKVNKLIITNMRDRLYIYINCFQRNKLNFLSINSREKYTFNFDNNSCIKCMKDNYHRDQNTT